MCGPFADEPVCFRPLSGSGMGNRDPSAGKVAQTGYTPGGKEARTGWRRGLANEMALPEPFLSVGKRVPDNGRETIRYTLFSATAVLFRKYRGKRAVRFQPRLLALFDKPSSFGKRCPCGRVGFDGAVAVLFLCPCILFSTSDGLCLLAAPLVGTMGQHHVSIANEQP